MRTSDRPICMICYSPETTSEFELSPSGARLALCGECEALLVADDRDALFARLEARPDPPARNPVSPETYRTVINDVLDQVLMAMARDGGHA